MLHKAEERGADGTPSQAGVGQPQSQAEGLDPAPGHGRTRQDLKLERVTVKSAFFIFEDFIYLFLERGEGEKGRETSVCVSSHVPPTGDLACNPGVCPDRESNQWPFGSQASTQSAEPHQPELKSPFWKDPSGRGEQGSLRGKTGARGPGGRLGRILGDARPCREECSSHMWVPRTQALLGPDPGPRRVTVQREDAKAR